MGGQQSMSSKKVSETERKLFRENAKLKEKLCKERLKNERSLNEQREIRHCLQKKLEAERQRRKKVACRLSCQQTRSKKELREKNAKIQELETQIECILSTNEKKHVSEEVIPARARHPGRSTNVLIYPESKSSQDGLLLASGSTLPKRKVVLDGQNVGCRGTNEPYNEDNILSAALYYEKRGETALIVLPDFRVNKRALARKLKSQLQQGWQVIPVPVGEDDDLFAIGLARRIGAKIVSNDQFRDHMKRTFCRDWLGEYLKKQRIPFEFIGGDYKPAKDLDS